VQAVVDVGEDVFLAPFHAVRVEVFGVGGACGPAVHAGFGVAVVVLGRAPVEGGGEFVVAAELVAAVVAALGGIVLVEGAHLGRVKVL